VEAEYWRLVLERDQHVQVQQGSIDTGDEGFGFPTSRHSSCGRHAWNLKVFIFLMISMKPFHFTNALNDVVLIEEF